MPNWNSILQEIQNLEHSGRFTTQAAADITRRKYLNELHVLTGRNVIAYYSGWLSKPNIGGMEINDEDKNGFMMAVNKLDRSLGLDLLLHTPGGSVDATQSIVDYLHRIFKGDIRAIVPQIAMSAGTMIACSCKEIWMGKQSNLGPIDPHLRGAPAYGVLDEFEKACREVQENPARMAVWNPIISQYKPSFLSMCSHAIDLSNEFVEQQLKKCMFAGKRNASKIAKDIVKRLSDYQGNKTHNRHIHIDECKEMGLVIKDLEEDDRMQDLVLTIHHCYMHSFMNQSAIKAIENHTGAALFKSIVQ